MEEKKVETERKYLIKYPQKLLDSIAEEDISEIRQTYLISEKGVTSRVRMRACCGNIQYTKTEKRRIDDVSCFEDESEISREQYLNELKFADPQSKTVEKRRCLLRHKGHIFEIDIYPFWADRAIMEIELSFDDEEFCIPPEIEIIREVTSDKRYKNACLAKEIPFDEI